MPARIQLFGSVQLTCDGTPVAGINTHRLQSLLAYLILKANTPQSREQLASLLWPESNESQARTNLRQLLHHLRRAVPPSCWHLTPDNQLLHWPRNASFAVDAHEFENALEHGAEAARKDRPSDERASIETALALYHDDLARDLYDDWLAPLREQYRQRMMAALGRLAALLETSGDLAAAIQCAERLVAQDPLSDAHHQLLIRLHIENHDRAGALRAYHQCLRVFRRELGVDPDPATRALYERALKSHAPAPAKTVPLSLAAASPLIGRDPEWQQLLDCWRLAERGKSHLAVIMGEPGIGKSRLAEQLYDLLASQQEDTVARARCYAAHGQLAYAPIAEWLRAGPLRSGLSQVPPGQLEELARVLPEVLADHPAIGRPLTENWERRHFFEALHTAFAAAPHPLLLVIDDLQWCDQDTIDYLQALLRSNHGAGILVLATLRPEETDRAHPASRLRVELAQVGQLTEIPLEPLDAQQTSELARQLSRAAISPQDVTELYRTTKGNPLFVVECIRAGLHSPDATRRIHAVIGARLAQLSPSAFELAGLAAAVGQSFSFDLLAKASDWDEASVSRALDELWHRRLIGGAAGGSDYDFTHDRIREVARDALSPVRRRFFHRRIARALEELHAGNLASVSLHLAAQYDDAGMPNEAIASYQQAAAVAQQRFADKEAEQLLRRALALCARFPESAKRDELELELLVTLGVALVTTLGYARPEVGETYGRALELSRALGEKKHLPFVLSGSWVYHVVRGQFDVARQMAQEAVDFATAENNEALVSAGHFTLGSCLFHLGQLKPSHQHMTRSIALHGNVSHSVLALFAGPDIGVFSRSYLSHLLWHRGFPDQAARSALEAIAAAGRLGNPFSMAIALAYAALLFSFRQESRTALEHARNGASLCEKYGFAYYGSIAQIVAGWAAAREGDPQAGLADLRQGLDVFRTTGAEIRLPYYYGLLADAYAMNGNTGEALANISSGFAFQSKNGETWSAADLHRLHGDLLLKAGNETEAQASYQKSLAAAEQAGSALFALRAHIRLAALTSDCSKLRKTLENFTEGFDTPDLVQARACLGRSAFT